MAPQVGSEGLAKRGNVLTQKFGVGDAADIVFANMVDLSMVNAYSNSNGAYRFAIARFRSGMLPLLSKQGVAAWSSSAPLDFRRSIRSWRDSRLIRTDSGTVAPHGATAGRERATTFEAGDGSPKQPGRERRPSPVACDGVHTCGRCRLVVWSVEIPLE